MEFPSVMNLTSLFPILGLLGGIFHFYSNFKRNLSKQIVDNLIRRRILVNSVLVMFKLNDNTKNKPKILLSQSYCKVQCQETTPH